jgi:prolipoprotein diacylglyceryl transferase
MNVLFSIPSPTISNFDIGPVRIHFYALFILVGIVAAILLGESRLKKRGAPAGAILDVALWAVPFGILGGRLFHVFTHPSDYFGAGKDLLKIFAVWEGGLAIYGALILGSAAAYIGCKQAGVKFLSFADAIAPGVLLAQAIGRWGNYFNNELYGKPTDLPWGLEVNPGNSAFPKGLPDGTLFHPTFLYEFLWNISGVFILLILDKRLNLRWGRLFALYLAYYSIGRFWIEDLRVDPSEVLLGLRANQWSSILGVVVAVSILVWSRRAHPGTEVSVLVEKPAERTEEKDALG